VLGSGFRAQTAHNLGFIQSCYGNDFMVGGLTFQDVDLVFSNIQEAAQKVHQFFIGFAFFRRGGYFKFPYAVNTAHHGVAASAGLDFHR